MPNTELRKQRVSQGDCADCGGLPLRAGSNICSDCFGKRVERQANRAARLKASGICIQCNASARPGKTLCQQCSDIVTDNAKLRRKANKLKVLALYGGECQQCGESDLRCLTLDHINNDGNVDCAINGKRVSSINFWAKVAKQPKRSDLMLLCANCHYKKDLAPWWYED